MVGKIKIIKWPGRNRTVGIKIISCQDFLTADNDTCRYFKDADIQINLFNNDVFEKERDLRYLICYLVENEDGERVFKKPIEARKKLSLQERSYFNQCYNEWAEQCWNDALKDGE